MNALLVIFIIYLVLLILIGFISYEKNNNQKDYLLAGRKLGPWVTALSERASGESAWLLLALPGAAISVGLSESWAVLGIIIGVICSWYLIAEKLRSETEKYDVLTIPEYLHRKFSDNSNFIRLFSAIIILFFSSFYVSAQFHASGKILDLLFDIEPLLGISISAIIIIIYTLMGGLVAVAWTDFLQGILMFGTLTILPCVAYYSLQDTSISINDALYQISENHTSFLNGSEGIASFGIILGGLSWGLGYFGQPHLLIRYMAIDKPENIRIARKVAIFWAIPSIIGAFLIGLFSIVYFGPDFFINNDPEQAMPLLAKSLLHPFIAGLFISGAVAAMMSTADSQLLVCSSALTEDIIHQFLGFELSEKNQLLMSRFSIMIIGFFAYSIAMFSQLNETKIFTIVSYAWSGLGSSFGPVLLLTFWWRGVTKEGVISGLVTGFLVTVVWSNSFILKGIITERLSSFFISLLSVYIISIYTKK